MTEGKQLLDFSSSDWIFVIVNTNIYFVAGVWVYYLAEVRAMSKRLLGKY
jgi:hypothetical protein